MRPLHHILPALTLLACTTSVAQPVGAARGRDPWVFRCLFEDRTRMLIVAPRPNVWLAFNTATGALQKAWQGEMVFRGKVWDFSQDSSMARGRVLLWRLPELIRLVDPPRPIGVPGSPREFVLPHKPSPWRLRDVEWSDGLREASKADVKPDTEGWELQGPDASVESPIFDATGMTRLFVAFDELSRKGPVRVEISNDAGKTWGQSFDSTTHGSRDDEWQWNFKAIALEPTPTMQIRLRQLDPAHAKRLRNVRVFGDEIAWWVQRGGKSEPAPIEWRGHEVHAQERMAVRLRIAGTDINERIDAETRDGAIIIRERFEVGELPSGSTLRLLLPRQTSGLRTCAPAQAMTEHELLIEKAGTYEIVATFENAEPPKEDAR